MTHFTVLLAEDHPAWGKLLYQELNDIPNLTAQGFFRSKVEIITAFENYRPDLLVLDVKLNDGCGLTVCEYCQQLARPVATLILTAYDEDVYMAWAMTGGALGYLLKAEVDLEETVVSIWRAARGEKLWTEDQLLRISYWQRAAGDKWKTLTEREREIVTALVEYKCDSEIAQELQLSQRTVNNHIARILEKLELENRREVARWAKKYNLLAFKDSLIFEEKLSRNYS